MKFPRVLIGLAFASALASTAGTASGQGQPAPPQPTDVQNIGAWTVRCFAVKSVSPCDMFEQISDKNSHQLILAISVAYIPSVDRHALQIVVPLGVSLAKGAVIETSSFTSPVLHYRRCDRAGCYIEMLIENSSIDSIAHSDPNAKVKIVADDGHTYELNFSLKGFSEAHDAMAALAKQQAAKPGDQTAPSAKK